MSEILSAITVLIGAINLLILVAILVVKFLDYMHGHRNFLHDGLPDPGLYYRGRFPQPQPLPIGTQHLRGHLHVWWFRNEYRWEFCLNNGETGLPPTRYKSSRFIRSCYFNGKRHPSVTDKVTRFLGDFPWDNQTDTIHPPEYLDPEIYTADAFYTWKPIAATERA